LAIAIRPIPPTVFAPRARQWMRWWIGG